MNSVQKDQNWPWPGCQNSIAIAMSNDREKHSAYENFCEGWIESYWNYSFTDQTVFSQFWIKTSQGGVHIIPSIVSPQVKLEKKIQNKREVLFLLVIYLNRSALSKMGGGLKITELIQTVYIYLELEAICFSMSLHSESNNMLYEWCSNEKQRLNKSIFFQQTGSFRLL